MKKKMIIFVLMTALMVLFVSVPVMAETAPAASIPPQLSDQQIKLDMLNWNAYVEYSKAAPGTFPSSYLDPITTINPDSVIGKSAIIHHYTQPVLYIPAIQPNPNISPITNQPYYYYTFQYS